MPDRTPSIAEIAALTARLRALSTAGRAAGPAEVDQFLADKRDLLDRIPSDDRDAEFDRHVVSVSRAAVARDAALEQQDWPAAARLAAETRAAIDATLAAGATRDEIARELDYPGGADALDGPHIDDLLATDSSDAVAHSEIPSPDHVAGDAGDPWAAYRAYTATEAAAELIACGIPPDEAPGVVDRYVDAMTWPRGWSSTDQWQIDDDDLAAMTDEPGLSGADGPTIAAGPVLTAEAAAFTLAGEGRPLDQARDDVARYLDEVSEVLGTPVHAWGLDDADLAALRADRAAESDPTTLDGSSDEEGRREQLNRWHDEDSRAAEAAVDCEAVGRAIDPVASEGPQP